MRSEGIIVQHILSSVAEDFSVKASFVPNNTLGLLKSRLFFLSKYTTYLTSIAPLPATVRCITFSVGLFTIGYKGVNFKVACNTSRFSSSMLRVD